MVKKNWSLWQEKSSCQSGAGSQDRKCQRGQIFKHRERSVATLQSYILKESSLCRGSSSILGSFWICANVSCRVKRQVLSCNFSCIAYLELSCNFIACEAAGTLEFSDSSVFALSMHSALDLPFWVTSIRKPFTAASFWRSTSVWAIDWFQHSVCFISLLWISQLL